MLGLISHKEKYFYTAKWISADDRNKTGFFKFKIITDDNTYMQDLENMSGTTGNAVWETKSGLPFEIDDIIIFRGTRFNITNIDGNRKAEEHNEQAYVYVKSNGNLVTRLMLRKAG